MMKYDLYFNMDDLIAVFCQKQSPCNGVTVSSLLVYFFNILLFIYQKVGVHLKQAAYSRGCRTLQREGSVVSFHQGNGYISFSLQVNMQVPVDNAIFIITVFCGLS